MTTSTTHINSAKTAPPLRMSFAILLFGVVALFANLNLEHNRYLSQGLLGQAESVPDADIALLFHKDTLSQRLVSPGAIGGGDSNESDQDKSKHSPAWLLLVSVDLILCSTRAKSFITTASAVFYSAPRTRTYSPRAPPRI